MRDELICKWTGWKREEGRGKRKGEGEGGMDVEVV